MKTLYKTTKKSAKVCRTKAPKHVKSIDLKLKALDISLIAANDIQSIQGTINAGGVQVRGENNTNVLAAYDIKEKIDTKTVTTNSQGRFVASIGSFNPLIGPGPNLTATDKSTTDIDSTRTAQLTTINGATGSNAEMSA